MSGPAAASEKGPSAPISATVFAYEKPEITRSKAVAMLARTDIAFAAVQVVRTGGENNLHVHTRTDGFWFVLSGRVRFYTTDDEVIADLGRHEGIVIPRGFPYWFESSGETDLELMQFEASTRSNASLDEFVADRTNIVGRLDLEQVDQLGEGIDEAPDP